MDPTPSRQSMAPLEPPEREDVGIHRLNWETTPIPSPLFLYIADDSHLSLSFPAGNFQNLHGGRSTTCECLRRSILGFHSLYGMQS